MQVRGRARIAVHRRRYNLRQGHGHCATADYCRGSSRTPITSYYTPKYVSVPDRQSMGALILRAEAPIPSLERDAALDAIHPFLESRHVYSRGRFGAWRHEVGDMDHAVTQGVEW